MVVVLCTTSSAEVVAHRGASAHRAEHTVAAYDLALAQGADRIELDVRPTADGTLVVLHDATLGRTTGVDRRLDEVTHADLQELCGDAAPLTLDAVLRRYGAHPSARLLVELKAPQPAWEARVAEALLAHDLAERTVVQSFDTPALRRLHAAYPWLECAPLYARRRGRRTLDAAARFAGGIGVWHRQVDAALVGAAHARGLAVRAWTVNDPAAIERLVALGVDGVITDRPDLATEIVSRRPALALAA
jgi:glycerophosphoryl diester phosphodiesterase